MKSEKKQKSSEVTRGTCLTLGDINSLPVIVPYMISFFYHTTESSGRHLGRWYFTLLFNSPQPLERFGRMDQGLKIDDSRFTLACCLLQTYVLGTSTYLNFSPYICTLFSSNFCHMPAMAMSCGGSGILRFFFYLRKMRAFWNLQDTLRWFHQAALDQ